MAETMHEDFSTALLCLYFALASEGKLDAEQPRVYFGPSRKESQCWGELFSLGTGTETWMSYLSRFVRGHGPSPFENRWQQYKGLKPDVWIHDNDHAIIIENKTGGHRAERERDYLDLLHEASFQRLKRAFLYSVPQEWLPNRKESEWWHFVRGREPGDGVIRGVIAWDDEFVGFLCNKLRLPKWFYDKLPNKVDEGRFLAPGEHFTGGQ